VSDPAAAGPGAQDDPAAEATVPPAGLWARMTADPHHAPEHLALEAVRRLGPEARDWAGRARADQPGASPDTLAQQAVRRFTTPVRISGAVSGAAGLPAAVVDVGVLAWTQCRMVLHIAAAYGVDPTAGERATDLLVLQGVHKGAESARVALGVAAGRERASALFADAPSEGGGAPVGRGALRVGGRLAQLAGLGATARMFAKVLPGTSVLIGTFATAAATTDLARRAEQRYRAA
jgi:EcsC protein family